MNKQSKIYIPGHGGLVGSSILRRLQEKGYNHLICRKRDALDLRRQEQVESFMEEQRPEYVFLAAAKVGGILANSTYKAEFIYDNIMIASNIIDASFRYGVQKLLNLGSACIYPKFAPVPLKEEYLLTGKLEPSNEPYAIAKITAIKMCAAYNEQYGTNFVSVMPTNLYGPGDNFDLESGHLLPALVRKFHLGKLFNEGKTEALGWDIWHNPIRAGARKPETCQGAEDLSNVLARLGITEEYVTVWGTGKPTREFLYADDLADACAFVMERIDCREAGEFINIGTGEEIRISSLAELIGDVVGFKGDIRYDPSKPDGTPRRLMDINRIARLGWEPKITLRQGIERTYDWYKRNCCP